MPRVTEGRRLGIFPLPLFVLLLCLAPAGAAPRLPDPAVKRPMLAIDLLPPEIPSKGVAGVYALRLGELFAGPEMAKVADQVNAMLAGGLTQFGIPLNLPVKVQDIEQVTGRVWVTFNGEKTWAGTLGMSITAVRMKEGYDWKALVEKQLPGVEFTERDGLTIFPIEVPHQVPGVPKKFHCAILDERTISLETYEEADSVVKAWVKKPRPAWAEEWRKYEDSHFALVLHNDTKAHARRPAEFDRPGDDPTDKEAGDVGVKLLQNTSRFFVSGDFRRGLQIDAALTAETAEAAAAAEKALAAIRTILKSEVEQLPEPGAALAPGRREAAAMMRDLLENFVIRRTGKQVALSLSSRKIGLATLQKLATAPGEEPPPGLTPPLPAGKRDVRVDLPRNVDGRGPSPFDPPEPVGPVADPPRSRGPEPKIDIPLPPQ
jgi:hypothetical protein